MIKTLLLAFGTTMFVTPAIVAGSGAPAVAANYFDGVTLIDQDGRSVALYHDLIEGHSVVINTFFSRCTGSCPVTMGTLKSLQSHLGARFGKEVRVVSITVDAAADTPATLHAYAERLNARPGWYFLTGSSEQVATALHRVGQYTAAPDDHMSLLIIGNDRTGLWKKALATAPAADVERVALSVLDDPGE